MEGVKLSLDSEINNWVKNKLSENWDKTGPKDRKIIRDGVHGSLFLEPHEVYILDSPLIQRLRQIYQNGLTFLVYPTCIQTRFDHTIGVAILADKFIEFLVNKGKYGKLISDTDKTDLKIASILHDVGHGLFSHASEIIYKNIDYFKSAKEQFDRNIRKVKPHEFLSYKIARSKPFKKFMKELSSLYGFEYNIKNISEFIVGKAVTNPDKQFLAEILNGTLDVDKLDYMKRDSHYLGFNLPVEIDQIMYRTKIITEPDYKLVIDIKGIHNIDQLIFNRAFYYSTVYLHHKIRAANCMLKATFKIIENDDNLRINGLRFDKVTDFLSINDHEFLSYKSSNPTLDNHIENMRNRNLYKRILELATYSIDNYKYKPDMWEKFNNDIKDESSSLKDEIIEKLKLIRPAIKDYEIWIDYPEIPKLTDLLPIVKISSKEDMSYLDIFDAIDFFDNYFTGITKERTIKLKIYIFGIPDNDFRRAAAKELTKYIKEKYQLVLKSSAKSKILKKILPLTLLSKIDKNTEKDFFEIGIKSVNDLCEQDLKLITKLIPKFSEQELQNLIKEGISLLQN